MKDKIIWIFITIFVLLGLGVILVFTSRTREITSIKSMHLSYSSGWSAYAYTIYDLEKKDDGYYVQIKPYGVPDDEVQDVKLTNKQIKELVTYCKQNNLLISGGTVRVTSAASNSYTIHYTGTTLNITANDSDLVLASSSDYSLVAASSATVKINNYSS